MPVRALEGNSLLWLVSHMKNCLSNSLLFCFITSIYIFVETKRRDLKKAKYIVRVYFNTRTFQAGSYFPRFFHVVKQLFAFYNRVNRTYLCLINVNYVLPYLYENLQFAINLQQK